VRQVLQKLRYQRKSGRFAIHPSFHPLVSLEFAAWFRSSIKENPGRNHVADCPAGFAVERFNLRVARVCWVSFDDRVSPKSAIIRSLNIDSYRSIPHIVAIDLDFGTRRLGDNLDFKSRSRGVRVGGAARRHQEKGGHKRRKNSVKDWEDPMHEICLIKNGSGSSRIFSGFSGLSGFSAGSQLGTGQIGSQLGIGQI
jgi:hypothetical protein